MRLGLRVVPMLALLSACGGDESNAVVSNEYCESVAGFSTNAAAAEEEVLRLVNARRAAGATCGTESRPAVGAVAMDPALRCAARVHSLDMSRRDYFDHVSPDGDGPEQRIERAGYEWRAFGENIAAGYPTPAAVVEGWMASPGHCRNIMTETFVHSGVGYVADGHLWTHVFATPR